MNDLEHEIREAFLRHEHEAPSVTPSELRRAAARTRRRQIVSVGGAGVATLALLTGLATGLAGLAQVDQAPTVLQQPPSDPAPTVWSPLHERGTSVVFDRAREDPADASLGWIDIRRVTTDDYNAGVWTLELAGKPPLVGDLESGRIITYGLVLDTTRDGVGDYLIGINNDVRRDASGGNFRVWVTDLATGETAETDGPGYGYPIEFGHAQGDGSMLFTFLPGSEPADMNIGTVRFYAWASETRHGDVVSWDTAPDTGWMGRP